MADQDVATIELPDDQDLQQLMISVRIAYRALVVDQLELADISPQAISEKLSGLDHARERLSQLAMLCLAGRRRLQQARAAVRLELATTDRT